MKSILILSATLAVALPALAQDTVADWDVTRDPDRKLTVAFTAFDNGLAIGTRCLNNSFQVLINGLPPATGEIRTLKIAFEDEEADEQRWNVGENREVAISDYPSPLARNLRKGGRMQIVVPGGAENGRNLRYVIDLPASGAAIDETLQACGRPLVDPRNAERSALPEDGLPPEIEWARQPRPTYPSGRTYTRGFATVTCLSQADGRLRDCMIESEHPMDGGFGKALLDSTRDARVRNRQGGELATRMIAFRTNFRMEEETTTGRRLRSN